MTSTYKVVPFFFFFFLTSAPFPVLNSLSHLIHLSCFSVSSNPWLKRSVAFFQETFLMIIISSPISGTSLWCLMFMNCSIVLYCNCTYLSFSLQRL